MNEKQSSLESFFGRKRANDETAEASRTASTKKISNYGFIVTGEPHLLCIICSERLPNETMKLSKLLQNIQIKHTALKDNPLQFFERKIHQLEGQKQLLRVIFLTNVSTLKASFIVADRITKAKKPFTDGDVLILPASKDFCSQPLEENQVKEIANVPFSAITIRKIDERADVVDAQLFKRINESPWYAIHVENATNVENKAILFVFVR